MYVTFEANLEGLVPFFSQINDGTVLKKIIGGWHLFDS